MSEKIEQLLNVMPDASGRRDYRGRQVQADQWEEGVPCGPLRAAPDGEGRGRDAQGVEIEGRPVRVGGDCRLCPVEYRTSQGLAV